MALEKFQEESKRWVALREYYRRNFTKTFRDFTEVQQRLCSQFLEDFKKKDIDVKGIAQFVSEKPLEEKGLFDGTMGQILWLCIYENSSEDHTYKDHSRLCGMALQRPYTTRSFHVISAMVWLVLAGGSFS